MNKINTDILLYCGLLILPLFAMGLKKERRKNLYLHFFILAQLLGYLSFLFLLKERVFQFNLTGVYLILSLLSFVKFNFIKKKDVVSYLIFFNLFFETSFLFAASHLSSIISSVLITVFTLLNSFVCLYLMNQILLENQRKIQLKTDEFILRNLEEKLFKSLKLSEKSALIPGIMHELSHPVTVLIARISQLRKILSTQETKNEIIYLLDQMKSQTDQVSKIIQHTREFFYENQNEKKVFSFTEIFQHLMHFWDQRLKNHGISFRMYGLENVELYSNPRDVEELILFFINSSFEAIEFLPNKWIELSSEIFDEVVRLRFSISELKGNGEFSLDLAPMNEICRKNQIKIYLDEDAHYLTWIFEIPRPPQKDEETLMYH